MSAAHRSLVSDTRRAAADQIVEAQLQWTARLAAANAWSVVSVATGMAIWADALEQQAASTRELLKRVETAGAAAVFEAVEHAAAGEDAGRRVDELIALYRAGEMGEGFRS